MGEGGFSREASGGCLSGGGDRMAGSDLGGRGGGDGDVVGGLDAPSDGLRAVEAYLAEAAGEIGVGGAT